jgi:hypothetical protein
MVRRKVKIKRERKMFAKNLYTLWEKSYLMWHDTLACMFRINIKFQCLLDCMRYGGKIIRQKLNRAETWTFNFICIVGDMSEENKYFCGFLCCTKCGGGKYFHYWEQNCCEMKQSMHIDETYRGLLLICFCFQIFHFRD